ncbi:MAG: M14 family metallopeptidase [Chitinophagaceae bacterium]|nr:M14 family metallopeptidase [Chitinophagaceae bacterium]
MKQLFFLFFAVSTFLTSTAQSITTRFEQSKGTQSPPYNEIITWWQQLDQKSGKVKMLTMGPSDSGFPLHLVVVASNGDSNFENIRKNNKRVILINNGIHPGEPDGIDASMLLVRDIVANKIQLPDNIVLAIIPVYNIGGCLNRSANYRVDQNGPEEFGFRGNSQNLDLNRDFIKCDSKEARSFAQIFHLTDPDVFVDNHVSNGADYQHIMTLLTSQHSKLGGIMGEYMNKTLEPGIYASMKEKGYDLVPYVSFGGNTPEAGMTAYFDGPRYSSGYASLWHTFAFVPETHMLKSYDLRVRSTYELMRSFIDLTSKNSSEISKLRKQTKASVKTQTDFPVSWNLDRNKSAEVTFKGFEAERKPSNISGQPRLFYDRTKPYEKKIKYFNYFDARTTIKKPGAYIIPQGWWTVIDLLKINNVQMRRFDKDTTVNVEAYRIDDYKAAPRPYEMHHLNSDVKVSATNRTMKFRKGDYYIPMNQEANRFLMEVLEPQADDSYFAWNYFDGILGQKEGFSGYAFEEIAEQFLRDNPKVKEKLDLRRSTDTAFAKNGSAQLNYIYQNSPYYEPDHLRYPVFRVIQ